MAQSYTPREMIERLVGFDTTSAKSNLELIGFVESYLQGHGVTSRRSANAEGTKANLFATIGPDIAGGVVLSGHSDVVPVAGQDWHSDPFTVIEKDGRLYGRGTSDMKSFTATALALVPEYLAKPLKRPLHIAISYDEEVGCVGVGGLIADVKESLPLPRMVIIGEPTEMQIINGHKGMSVFTTAVRGKPAHSSQSERGASAIMAAGQLVAFLSDLAAEKRAAAPDDCPFEPPYTTFNVGLIEGGTALNIIPQDCRFTWEFRILPGDEAQDIRARFDAYVESTVLPRLQEFVPEAGIVTETLAYAPALRPEEKGAAETLVRHLSGLNDSGAVSFATEGGLFQDAGFSTVMFGPGSIDQAHQPNEFIDLSQVAACEAFLKKLGDWACSEGEIF